MADINQWQFPRNHGAKVIGWRSDGKGLENKDWVSPADLDERAPALSGDTMLVDNTTGTARENKTFAQVRGLLDVPWLSETNEQPFSGPISAPYVLPTYRGLKISEFLTTNDAWDTSKRAALQAALDVLVSNDRYTGLDLEGRLLIIDAPLNLGTNNLFFPQKQIHNGYIYAMSTFPEGGYLFDLSANPDMRNFHFHNIYFMGAGRAGWFKMPIKYKSIRFSLCQFLNCKGNGDVAHGAPASRYFGIYDWSTPVGGNHEFHISDSFFDSGQSIETSTNRDRMAIFSNSPDWILCNNIGQYFHTWFYGRSGAYQFLGNHIWSDSDGTTPNRMCTFTKATSALGAIFVGNYIDGVVVWLSNADDTASRIGGVSLCGNFFLATPTVPVGFSFVRLSPEVANTGVTGITMTGNVYDNNGSVVFSNIDVAPGAVGSIDPENVQRVLLDDPGIDVSRNGRVYKSKARYNHLIAAEATQAFSFANAIPPWAKIKRSTAAFSRAGGADAMAYAVPRITGTATVTVDLSASSNGRLECEVDINSDDYATT